MASETSAAYAPIGAMTETRTAMQTMPQITTTVPVPRFSPNPACFDPTNIWRGTISCLQQTETCTYLHLGEPSGSPGDFLPTPCYATPSLEPATECPTSYTPVNTGDVATIEGTTYREITCCPT
jgi:hypothetical protein